MHKALFQVKIQLNNFDSFSWNTAFSVNVSKHFIVELSRAFPSKTERSGKSSAARCCMNKHQRSMYCTWTPEPRAWYVSECKYMYIQQPHFSRIHYYHFHYFTVFPSVYWSECREIIMCVDIKKEMYNLNVYYFVFWIHI